MHAILLLSALLSFGADPIDGDAPETAGEGLQRFLDAAHGGDFTLASEALTLRPDEVSEGPRLARRLMFVLDQQLALEPAALSAHNGRAKLGEIALGRGHAQIEMDWTGERWRFTARTVRAIDPLFAEHGSPLWDLLPPALVTHSFGPLGHWQWAGLGLLLALAFFLARAVTALARPIVRRLAALTVSKLDDWLVEALERPVRYFLMCVVIAAGTRSLAFPSGSQNLVDDLTRSATIAIGVWALVIVGRLVSQALEERARKEKDELSQRAIKTQVTVLNRVWAAVVVLLGAALVLLQFPGVRNIGMSLLASAGVAGVVLGLAAQRTISNLLAGIQISLTQPIRIGDTVIVEKEWGWIEEITLTYVVVKVWDLRRLVVPIAYFLEKPFQNWTRSSSRILGTVEVFADYRVDVEAARVELARILDPERGKLWDGETQSIQVTELSEQTMTLRALVSSDDAGKSWDLRCLVRERLVRWLTAQQPSALPRVRTELQRSRAAS